MTRAASIALTLCLALAACGGEDGGEPPATAAHALVLERGEPKLSPPSGAAPRDLVVEDLVEGPGAAAKPGDELTVEYVGIRYDGTPFTNSWKRAKPFSFELGSRTPFANLGWEKGLVGMRVGGRRRLAIPPKLQSFGGTAPAGDPSDTLLYVIDLVAIR